MWPIFRFFILRHVFGLLLKRSLHDFRIRWGGRVVVVLFRVVVHVLLPVEHRMLAGKVARVVVVVYCTGGGGGGGGGVVIAVGAVPLLLPVDHVRRGGGARARRVVQPHGRHRPRAGAAVQELRRLLLALLLRLEHLLSESVIGVYR